MTVRRRSEQAGFALIAVIWGLGLATLLGSAAIVGSRNRLRGMDDVTAVAAAAAGAESAVLFGIRQAMDGDPRYMQGRPVSCRFPDRGLATVLITPESGKIDLNAAGPDRLARFFAALTGDPRRGSHLAEALVAFRGKPKPGPDGGPAPGPGEAAAHAPLSTVLELDRIPGLSTDLLYRALPFVTVATGKPDFDPGTAAPALLALLGLPPGPRTAMPPATGGAVTIHAVLTTAGGAWAVRDALVELGETGTFAIREWRVGRRDAATDAESDGAAPVSGQTCLL